MKKITIKYNLEVPEDHIDKICRIAQCGKRVLERDIKHMAEISGRHRVYEFTQSFIKNKEDS